MEIKDLNLEQTEKLFNLVGQITTILNPDSEKLTTLMANGHETACNMELLGIQIMAHMAKLSK